LHFEYSHELDAPLDAVELAVLSPAMGPMLAKALSPGIASVEIVEHVVEGGELKSVLRYQASAPIALFKGRTIAPDALMWEAHQTYRIATHEATWEVLPKEQYRRYFRASGRYFLTSLPDGRTRRTVEGELLIPVPVPMIGPIAERVALTEVRKTYDAEADVLRSLAIL
jgi:hypothetical protein